MSRTLRLSEDKRNKILEAIKEQLTDLKITDDKLQFSFNLNDKEAERIPLVRFTVPAYMKMRALVTEFSSEIAWHGTVDRVSEDEFIVKDILVYPQEVTGSTVNTDQEEYQNWLYSLEDDEFNSLRFQGHSHVSMSVSPSGVDSTHQSEIVEQLGDDDYYIFMITNKRDEYWVCIYDMLTNCVYSTDEIELAVEDTGLYTQGFVDNAKDMVKQKSYYSTKKGKAVAKSYPSSNELEDEEDYVYGYLHGRYGSWK